MDSADRTWLVIRPSIFSTHRYEVRLARPPAPESTCGQLFQVCHCDDYLALPQHMGLGLGGPAWRDRSGTDTNSWSGSRQRFRLAQRGFKAQIGRLPTVSASLFGCFVLYSIQLGQSGVLLELPIAGCYLFSLGAGGA